MYPDSDSCTPLAESLHSTAGSLGHDQAEPNDFDAWPLDGLP